MEMRTHGLLARPDHRTSSVTRVYIRAGANIFSSPISDLIEQTTMLLTTEISLTSRGSEARNRGALTQSRVLILVEQFYHHELRRSDTYVSFRRVS